MRSLRRTPFTPALSPLLAVWMTACAALASPAVPACAQTVATPANAPSWSTETVQSRAIGATQRYEARIEAVRQSQITAQVPGAITQLAVKAGDRVAAGQLLLRIDARAAEQNAQAAQAGTAAARAQMDVAQTELARKRQLFAKNYISKAALEQAEATYRAATAQTQAQAAQTQAAQAQTGFHVIRAPYAGVVSQVNVALGDMAMPGRPLLTLYDPGALRVAADVPSSAIGTSGVVGASVLGADQRPLAITRVQVLPSVDPNSLTQVVRADLLAPPANVVPGQAVNLTLPSNTQRNTQGAMTAVITVPQAALVRRAELVGVYVLSAQNQPLLRQVRLGLDVGERVEVLSGLQAGDRVLLQPQLALRATKP